MATKKVTDENFEIEVLKATKVGATTKSNIVSWIKENI